MGGDVRASEEQVRADDRAHVFHSWSAQGLIDPMPIAAAEGSYFWDYDGKRYLDFSSQLVNVNIGHQHPQAGGRDPGAGGQALHRRARVRRRRAVARPPASSPSSRPAISTWCSSPTAAPRRTRTPCGWPACTPAATR